MEKLYSTIEASQLLGISRIAVFNKIKNGVLPAIKIGRNYAITQHALDRARGVLLNDADRREIDVAVQRTVKEFGETLKKLAQE